MENNTTATVQRRKNGPRWSRFVFTLNNWSETEWIQLKTLEHMTTWGILGKETAPVTGTKHIQGACTVGKQVALSTIKKWPGLARAHIEEMKGSPLDSQKYCSKEGDFYEWGKKPKPGERTDLINVAKKVLEGATMQQLANDIETSTMVVKYHRGLTALRSYITPPRDPNYPPQIIWISGPTGTSKTRTAFEAARRLFGCDPWISSGTLQWFDGYDGQPAAIFDDLRTRHCSFDFLLRLLDRYPFRVPIKGGMVEWNPRLILITSPYGAKQMWNLKTEEALAQLTRRITLEVSAPEGLHGVYELLRLEDPGLVVPMLQGGPVDTLDVSIESELSFRELFGLNEETDYYKEIPQTVPYFSDEENE